MKVSMMMMVAVLMGLGAISMVSGKKPVATQWFFLSEQGMLNIFLILSLSDVADYG